MVDDGLAAHKGPRPTFSHSPAHTGCENAPPPGPPRGALRRASGLATGTCRCSPSPYRAGAFLRPPGGRGIASRRTSAPAPQVWTRTVRVADPARTCTLPPVPLAFPRPVLPGARGNRRAARRSGHGRWGTGPGPPPVAGVTQKCCPIPFRSADDGPGAAPTALLDENAPFRAQHAALRSENDGFLTARAGRRRSSRFSAADDHGAPDAVRRDRRHRVE